MGRIMAKIMVMFTRTKMKFLTSNRSLLRRRCIKVNVNDTFHNRSFMYFVSFDFILIPRDRNNFSTVRIFLFNLFISSPALFIMSAASLAFQTYHCWEIPKIRFPSKRPLPVYFDRTMDRRRQPLPHQSDSRRR